MKKITFVLTLVVAYCFVLVSVAEALTDFSKRSIEGSYVSIAFEQGAGTAAGAALRSAVEIERIEKAKNLEKKLDVLVQNGDTASIAALKPEMDRINGFKAAERLELEIPVGLVRLRYLNALKKFLFNKA